MPPDWNVIQLLPDGPDSFAQGDEQDNAHSAADQGGDQLGDAEGGGQGVQHGCFQDSRGQELVGQKPADHFADSQVQHTEFCSRCNKLHNDPGNGQTGFAPVGHTENQHKGQIAQHNRGDGDHVVLSDRVIKHLIICLLILPDGLQILSFISQ